AGFSFPRARSAPRPVRPYGPPAARRSQAVRHEGISDEVAASQQRDTDRARSSYVSHFYPRERWEDPTNYHLVIDSTVLSLDACVELIVAAARDLFARIAEQESKATR